MTAARNALQLTFESTSAELLDQGTPTASVASDSDSDQLQITPADLESLQLSAVEQRYPATPYPATAEQTHTNPYYQHLGSRSGAPPTPVPFNLDVPVMDTYAASSSNANAAVISYKGERGTKFSAFLQPFIAQLSKARDNFIVSKGKDLDVSLDLKQFLNSMPPDDPAYTTARLQGSGQLRQVGQIRMVGT